MLNAHNITVMFSGEDLFSGISFKLIAGDRIGLVGKNGAGKSTLLKIIANEQEYDKGTIALEKELKIGFLKQDIEFEKGRTVLQEAYQAFEEIVTIEKKLEQVNTELAERTDYESDYYSKLIHDLDEFQNRYELLGGYNYQGNTEKILKGLGFKEIDFNNLTETFSGGWRMRIELAKLLLQNNDILLLDEPTNHLDIESIIWFENFLKGFTGAIMMVSHDRMFLDNVTNRTIEISLGQIYDFKRAYSGYLVLRGEIKEKQLQSQKNQAKEIQRTEQLISKFRAKANKASMAQSLIKKLNKIERIEVDIDDNAVMKVRFPISINPGKVVFEIENLSKNYDEKQVLTNVNLRIERNSKLAFVGQNGQGKTTLAKIMVGEIPFKGQCKLGHNVQIGYFAQNQVDYLDGEKTVLQTMEDAATDSNRLKVRDMLGAFLFGGDASDKKVKVLSGGERNRLAICKMLLMPFNVLIMDEPTNHLDIASKNVLKKALHDYEGTLILVSHDRDFLQGLTSRIYEFKDQKIKEYLGDINYYLETHNLENMREAEKKFNLKKKAVKTQNPKLKNQNHQAIKNLKKKINAIENKISRLEKEIISLDVELSKDFEQASKREDFFKTYQGKKDQMKFLEQNWENLHEDIEKLELVNS
ncbi:MAG: ATP-binding cassette domain-containing protein [Flavobacteriaceae bacterium]|nr:ATP-binding cassette domain-containing protein [Flavobacteriaceae bacterium]